MSQRFRDYVLRQRKLYEQREQVLSDFVNRSADLMSKIDVNHSPNIVHEVVTLYNRLKKFEKLLSVDESSNQLLRMDPQDVFESRKMRQSKSVAEGIRKWQKVLLKSLIEDLAAIKVQALLCLPQSPFRRTKVSPICEQSTPVHVFHAEVDGHFSGALKMAQSEVESVSLTKELAIYQSLTQSHPNNMPGFYQLFRLRGKTFLFSQWLGYSLAMERTEMNRPFSLTTICLIALSLIELLRKLHHAGVPRDRGNPSVDLQNYVGGDIRPEHIFMGTEGSERRFYFTDYSAATVYEDVCERPRTGTVGEISEFSSIAEHEGLARHPVDDMESLGYMLVSLADVPLWDDSLNSRAMGGLKLKWREDGYCACLECLPLQKYLSMCGTMRTGKLPVNAYDRLKKVFSDALERTRQPHKLDWE